MYLKSGVRNFGFFSIFPGASVTTVGRITVCKITGYQWGKGWLTSTDIIDCDPISCSVNQVLRELVFQEIGEDNSKGGLPPFLKG